MSFGKAMEDEDPVVDAFAALGSVRAGVLAVAVELEKQNILRRESESGLIERKVRLDNEQQFAWELAATLAERDAKLIEIEREALIRAELLDEASRASAELETENAVLARLLDEASNAAAGFEIENANLAKLLEEASGAAAAFERENAILARLLDEASVAASKFEKENAYLTQVLEVNGLALAEYAKRAEAAEELLSESGEASNLVGCGLPGAVGGDGGYTEAGPLSLQGAGWHDAESDQSGDFRWVGGVARLNIAQLTRAPYELLIEVEPGPGVGNEPFDLIVYEADIRLTALTIRGRETRRIELAPGEPRVRQLTLVAEATAPPIAVPDDPRVLDYRVFRLALKRRKGDVVSLASGLSPSDGWYHLEVENGETFRWAGSEVAIEAEPGGPVEDCVLDVEPGPGVGGPLRLEVLAGDTVYSAIIVTKRERIRIPWPESNQRKVKLRVDGGGKFIESDPRLLNFRAFGTVD